MNANELADNLNDGDVSYITMDKAATMLRQQQAVIEDLEKENTDLRYLIATKLEQQDGISLNSMAHPITNTPEPSYEIDPDKLETIEIDLPSSEPVAWAVWEGRPHDLFFYKEEADELCRLKGGDAKTVPLYTHPAEHDLGIAEAIGFEKGHKSAEDMLRQQQAEIEALKVKAHEWYLIAMEKAQE